MLLSYSTSPLTVRPLSFLRLTDTVPPAGTCGVTSKCSTTSAAGSAGVAAGGSGFAGGGFVPAPAAPVMPTPAVPLPLIRLLNAPGAASVPLAKRVSAESGRARLRTMRGVISSTTSVLLRVSVCTPNSRPSSGMAESPGTPAALRRSSSLMRPARICVSPSFRRSEVEAWRVPIS